MTAQFIYDKAPFPSCHASTIVEAEAGRFLAAWFGGAREGADDVAIWLARFDGRWSHPEKVANEPGKPCWNPVLFRERATSEIQLYYKAGPSPDTTPTPARPQADSLPAGLALAQEPDTACHRAPGGYPAAAPFGRPLRF